MIVHVKDQDQEMAPRVLPTRLLEARAAATGFLVVGIDDCGRGAIAGPIFAAAALLPGDWACPAGVAFGDAKLLTAEQRALALRALDDAGAIWATAAVPPAAVDAQGHRAATEAAMALAAARLLGRIRRCAPSADAPCFCLVDGDAVPAGPWSGAAVPQGDAAECCISAASIAARVARDSCMSSLARRWPFYEWTSNGGHASAQHLAAIVSWGPCDAHRATCFPFARPSGRRSGYHPHKVAHQQIQKWMRRAVDAGAETRDGARPARQGAELDGAADAERLRRFGAMAQRMRWGAAGRWNGDEQAGGALRPVTGEGKRQRRRGRAAGREAAGVA
jgi:ribonuclease HII